MLARLQRRFSPRRTRLSESASTPLDGGEANSLLCLVGRELCLFTTLDASKAPSRQRESFIALAVRRMAPFPDPDFDIAWSDDGTAAIWYWSRSRATAALSGEAAVRKRFVAEALYVGQPHEDEAELLALHHGVDARIWKHGKLVASRWWPQHPTAAEWSGFLQGAGLPHGQADAPTPLSAPLASTPWNQRRSGVDRLNLSAFEHYLPKLAIGCGIAFALAASVELGGIARAQIGIWRARSAASQLDAPLQRILDARQVSDQARGEITGLLSLHDPRPTTSLMAELTRLLPGKQWAVKEWRQPSPDTVVVTVIVPGGNPEQLVSTFESSPVFKGVSTELGSNNELTIKASIKLPPSLSDATTP